MLRVVVAVALAVALLGASLPAIERARTDHAAATVEAQLDHLERVATRLQTRNDAVPAGLTGARRYVTLQLPARSWGSAGLVSLTIPGYERVLNGDAVSKIRWHVGGNRRSIRPSTIPLVGPSDGLTLRRGGRTRVVLHHVSIDGRQVVLVSRPGFKLDDATSPGHVGTSDAGRPPPGRLR